MNNLKEIIVVLEKFLKNETTTYEWDDTMGVISGDPRADAVRRICNLVSSAFPPKEKSMGYTSPQGSVVLQTLLDELKKSEP